MPSAKQMEKQPPRAKSERESAPRRVEAGLEHFADLFRPPEGVVEHIPEAEVRDKLQTFQREFTGFLIDQVGESFGRASEQAQTDLRTLAEILNGLPQGVAKFERTKDKKTVSLTIEGPTNSVRLNIDLGEERRAQRIRLGLRDAKNNETLVLDIHYYPPRNRLQMELKGRDLGEAALRHKDFPVGCSDQETFTQLQLLLAFNLCPTEGEDDKTTTRYLTTKETYLKQLLKELGMRGKVAKDENREEIIREIMARCPGTLQYQEAQEQQQKKREGEKEKARRERGIEKEGQEQLEIIAKCADELEQVIARTVSLTGWLAQQREKLELPPEITNGRIVLGFILDMPPDELDEEARGCELSDGEKILISDIPDLTTQAIQAKQDLEKGSAEDALQYMRDLAESMRDYEG